MQKSLTKYTDKEIQSIQRFSKQLNRLLKQDHAQALLVMMKDHVDEIKGLHDKKDKHYLIETGDLIVLCLELIMEAKQSPDVVLLKCYPRFHKKILQLIKDQQDQCQ